MGGLINYLFILWPTWKETVSEVDFFHILSVVSCVRKISRWFMVWVQGGNTAPRSISDLEMSAVKNNPIFLIFSLFFKWVCDVQISHLACKNIISGWDRGENFQFCCIIPISMLLTTVKTIKRHVRNYLFYKKKTHLFFFPICWIICISTVFHSSTNLHETMKVVTAKP